MQNDQDTIDLALKYIDVHWNVDDATDEGFTVLMGVATLGDYGVMKALLKHGADPGREDAYGWTACRYAQFFGENIVAGFLHYQEHTRPA